MKKLYTVYFIRNTHDENNEWRGDSYFGIPDHMDHQARTEFEAKELFFGVHTWNGSGEKLTFDQIYQRTLDMLRGGAYDGKWDKSEYRFSPEATLKALSFMIEHKLVLVEVCDTPIQ